MRRWIVSLVCFLVSILLTGYGIQELWHGSMWGIIVLPAAGLYMSDALGYLKRYLVQRNEAWTTRFHSLGIDCARWAVLSYLLAIFFFFSNVSYREFFLSVGSFYFVEFIGLVHDRKGLK